MSEEVKLALKMGYKLIAMHEVWHWDETQRDETLFRPYIQRAYREKIEASGLLITGIFQILTLYILRLASTHYRVDKEAW